MGLFDITADALSPTDYAGFANAAFDSLHQNLPRLGALEAQLIPQQTLNAINRQNLSMFGNPDAGTPGSLTMLAQAQPILSQINRNANTQARLGDIDDVIQNTGRVKDIFTKANQSLFDQMNIQQTGSPLMDTMRAQSLGDARAIPAIDTMFAADNARLRGFIDTAAEDVARQGKLSDEQLRDVTQQSRTADNDRGLFRSNRSAANEILNTEAARKRQQSFSDQRLANMQGLLGQSESRNLAIRNNLFQNARATEAMDFGQGQQRIQNRISTMFDPFQPIVGRQAVNQLGGGSAFGGAGGIASQGIRNSLLDDFGSLMSGMASNEMNTRVASANANAGVLGGLFGGIGSAIGGIFG